MIGMSTTTASPVKGGKTMRRVAILRQVPSELSSTTFLSIFALVTCPVGAMVAEMWISPTLRLGEYFTASLTHFCRLTLCSLILLRTTSALIPVTGARGVSGGVLGGGGGSSVFCSPAGGGCTVPLSRPMNMTAAATPRAMSTMKIAARIHGQVLLVGPR